MPLLEGGGVGAHALLFSITMGTKTSHPYRGAPEKNGVPREKKIFYKKKRLLSWKPNPCKFPTSPKKVNKGNKNVSGSPSGSSSGQEIILKQIHVGIFCINTAPGPKVFSSSPQLVICGLLWFYFVIMVSLRSQLGHKGEIAYLKPKKKEKTCKSE